ncbi:MAG: phage integrase SAM-like domain-containing protein, partial [Bacteroidales bacterium]
MATIKFILKPSTDKERLSTLYLRLRHGRAIDLTTSTEFRIKASQWSDKKHQPKQHIDKKIRESLNTGLENLRNHILGEFNKAFGEKEEINTKWLKEKVHSFHHPGVKKHNITLVEYIDKFIKEIESGERKFRKRTGGGSTWERYKPSTIKVYKEFKTQIEEYEKARKRTLKFNDINMEFYKDYVNFFEEKNYKTNSIGKQIKHLKTIMKAAEKENLHTNQYYNNDEFITFREEIEAVYLNEKEIYKLYKLDLSGKDLAHWEIARDVFLVGCWTALRFGDYSRINQNHIARTGG